MAAKGEPLAAALQIPDDDRLVLAGGSQATTVWTEREVQDLSGLSAEAGALAAAAGLPEAHRVRTEGSLMRRSHQPAATGAEGQQPRLFGADVDLARRLPGGCIPVAQGSVGGIRSQQGIVWMKRWPRLDVRDRPLEAEQFTARARVTDAGPQGVDERDPSPIRAEQDARRRSALAAEERDLLPVDHVPDGDD